MAWIRTVAEDEAEGLVKREYDAAIKRAGRVFNIVKIHSLKPELLRLWVDLYKLLMYGPSGLSRAQREMIAVVVSRLNQCHYWVEAHAEDLRTVTKDDALVEQIKRDYRKARIDATTRLMLEYVEKVTFRAHELGKNEIEELRKAGFDDEDILDIVHITSFFSHINRIADALGVELEDFMPPHPKRT